MKERREKDGEKGRVSGKKRRRRRGFKVIRSMNPKTFGIKE